MAELLERYIEFRQGVRYTTKQSYKIVLKLLQREEFDNRLVTSIRTSDAKLWFMKL